MILKSRTLSRTSDTTETRNPCVIKVILLDCFTYIDIFNLLNLFWHTDKNFCFFAEVNFWDFVRNDNSNKGTTARLNETSFGPLKKVVPNISRPKKYRHFLMHCVQLPDNFQMREHSWLWRFHITFLLFSFCWFVGYSTRHGLKIDLPPFYFPLVVNVTMSQRHHCLCYCTGGKYV